MTNSPTDKVNPPNPNSKPIYGFAVATNEIYPEPKTYEQATIESLLASCKQALQERDALRAENERLKEDINELQRLGAMASERNMTRIGELLAENERLNAQRREALDELNFQRAETTRLKAHIAILTEEGHGEIERLWAVIQAAATEPTIHPDVAAALRRALVSDKRA